MQLTKELFEVIFPKGVFEYFDITKVVVEKEVKITFTEKDIPPLTEDLKDKKIIDKMFHDITITDYPLRGRKTLLIFRRRYWKLKGVKEYLKRDIQLAFKGTQLEKEFAVFLKGGSRKATCFPGIHRSYQSS